MAAKSKSLKLDYGFGSAGALVVLILVAVGALAYLVDTTLMAAFEPLIRSI